MPIAPWNPGGWYPFQYGSAGIQPYRGSGAAPTTGATGTVQGTSSLPSGPVSNYSAPYGGVPSVPSPAATQQDVLAGNLASLGSLYNLATGTGSASAAGALTQLNQNLPGYSGLQGQNTANISSLLSGNIPADVMRQLQQGAAERGVSIGSPDAPNTNEELLRLLGTTSLGLQQTGQQDLASAVGMTPTGPQFNPATMFNTPEQQQMAQLLANYLAAAPIPSAAAGANLASLLGGVGRGAGATGGGGVGNFAPTTGAGGGANALGFGFGGYQGLATAAGGGGGGGNVFGGPTFDPNDLSNPYAPTYSGVSDAYNSSPWTVDPTTGFDTSLVNQNLSLQPGADQGLMQNFDFTDPNWWNNLVGSGSDMTGGDYSGYTG